MTNCPVSGHLLLVQILAAVHVLGYFIIQILLLAFVHTEKDRHNFFHRQTGEKSLAKKILEEYCFVDFIQDSKLAHFQMLVNDLD